MGILSAFGLMRVSEHELLIDNSVTFHLKNYAALEAKFKKAVTDLADARCSLEDERSTFNQRLADAVQDYQADALKWRARASREQKRGQAKRKTA